MSRFYFARIPEGFDVHDFLKDFIVKNKLEQGVVVGIGGLEYAEVGYYNPKAKSYSSIVIKADETIIEVGSLIGNYTLDANGSIRIHLHVVVSKPNETIAGHLIKGVVKPFLELFIIDFTKWDNLKQ